MMLTYIAEYCLNKYNADVCTGNRKMALKFLLYTCIDYILNCNRNVHQEFNEIRRF